MLVICEANGAEFLRDYLQVCLQVYLQKLPPARQMGVPAYLYALSAPIRAIGG
jgi:hypothetical protein